MTVEMRELLLFASPPQKKTCRHLFSHHLSKQSYHVGLFWTLVDYLPPYLFYHWLLVFVFACFLFLEFQIIRFVISTFTPILFTEIPSFCSPPPLLYAGVMRCGTSLGFILLLSTLVCCQPELIWVSFLFQKFSSLLPPPLPIWPLQQTRHHLAYHLPLLPVVPTLLIVWTKTAQPFHQQDIRGTSPLAAFLLCTERIRDNISNLWYAGCVVIRSSLRSEKTGKSSKVFEDLSRNTVFFRTEVKP